MRPSVVILGSLGALVGALVIGYYDIFDIVIAMFVVVLLSGAGNALNDYYDYKIDKTNKPGRPIPSGKIKRIDAFRFATILYVAGLLLCMTLSIYCFILAIVNTILTVIYSKKIKTMTVFGGAFPSWLAASTFLFGGLLTETVNITILALVAIAFFGNFGREIVKDIEDIEGDKKGGKKTIPIIYGEDVARAYSIICVFIAIILMALPWVFDLLNVYYIFFILITDIVLFRAIRHLKKNPAKSQKLMKLAMFIVILAFIAGTI
ncbi:MAG: UbiA family prenyltransferase [Nanoarchaeota archaeon]|nr:UbiA family prenyltransferase [Nanoarchaeota archaeon]MBU4124179.1 UbiA family prenyltransferase [Nanoarchaeota archaeon]